MYVQCTEHVRKMYNACTMYNAWTMMLAQCTTAARQGTLSFVKKCRDLPHVQCTTHVQYACTMKVLKCFWMVCNEFRGNFNRF